MAPRLDPNSSALQIVDGNNYLLQRLQNDTNGLVYRNIIADITQCTRPPVFVFDGVLGNLRRRKLFPPYKIRPPMKGENVLPSLELFVSLIPLLPCVHMRLLDWEADDVMATIARQQSAIGAKSRIITTDRDMTQLAADALIEVTAEPPEGIHPSQVRLYKTFIGDASDKIPGVYNFGPKSWARLNKVMVQTLIENSDDFSRYTPDQLGMNPPHHSWCCHNQEKLALYWELVRLQDVPMCELRPAVKVGTNQPHKINEILSEFML